MSKYVVMPTITHDGKSMNRKTCFERNALCATKDEADIEAIRRNKAEQAAGHTNVEWWVCPPVTPELEAMAKLIAARKRTH